MVLPEEIIEMLRQKSGLSLHAPNDSKLLADAIYAETNEMLGLSTIKRLLGLFHDTRSPRQSTLDIIARYLGSSDWDALMLDKCGSESGFDTSLQHHETASLAPGTIVRICYHPNRVLELRHLEGITFEVLSYSGTKLQKGDILFIYEIARYFPLIVKDVLRQGRSLGTYVAGRHNGVQEVTLLPPIHTQPNQHSTD